MVQEGLDLGGQSLFFKLIFPTREKKCRQGSVSWPWRSFYHNCSQRSIFVIDVENKSPHRVRIKEEIELIASEGQVIEIDWSESHRGMFPNGLKVAVLPCVLSHTLSIGYKDRQADHQDNGYGLWLGYEDERRFDERKSPCSWCYKTFWKVTKLGRSFTQSNDAMGAM